MYVMVFTFVIFEQSGSAVYAALFPFIRTMGNVMASFFSPYLVAVTSLRKVMCTVPLVKAGLLTFFLFTFEMSGTWIGVLLLFTAGASLLEGVIQPLYQATTPMLVKEKELVQANSVMSFSFQTLQVAGYTVTGVLVAAMGSFFTFIICLGLLWLGWLSLLMVLPGLFDISNTLNEQAKEKWGSVKAGWSLVWKNKTVRWVTFMDVTESAAGAVWVGAVTLIFVTEALNVSTDWWGYINSSYYSGAILGGLLAFFLARVIREHLFVSMAVGSFLYGLVVVVYGFTTEPLFALALVLLIGPLYQIRDIAQRTLLQKSVKVEDISQVYAAHSVLLSAAVGFSVLVVGAIAEILGIRVVYVASGVIVTAMSALALTVLRFNLRKETNDVRMRDDVMQERERSHL